RTSGDSLVGGYQKRLLVIGCESARIDRKTRTGRAYKVFSCSVPGNRCLGAVGTRCGHLGLFSVSFTRAKHAGPLPPGTGTADQAAKPSRGLTRPCAESLADAHSSVRPRLRERGPRGVPRCELYGRVGRGTARDRTERGRQILLAPTGCGAAAPGGRPNRHRGRRIGPDPGRAGA